MFELLLYKFFAGFNHEGIFRINGSARVVEKLKNEFDSQGNSRLEEEDDIMAVAGLLKLFLRELPDAIIPVNLTQQFVNIQEGFYQILFFILLHFT